jgi:low temperature requirement protein LtrA
MAGDRRVPRAPLARAYRLFRLPSRPDTEAERHATWLELFFDLVFVLALSAVTARLNTVTAPTWAQIGIAFGIFGLVQWAWVGQAFYDTRYDPDDNPHRLLVLLAATGAATIALGTREVPAGVELPAGYLVLRGSLLIMYLRVLVSDRSSREVVVTYFIGFTAGWLLWLASLWVPVPTRPALWITALLIELCTPWIGRHWLIRHPVHRSHLPERMGQFIIILLGGSLANLLAAVPIPHPGSRTLAAAGLSLVVSIGIWWVYTAFLNSRLALPRLASGLAYGYLHLPVGAGILFAGWAMARIVHFTDGGAHQVPTTVRLALAGSLLMWMLGGLGLQWFSQGALSRRRLIRSALGIVPIAVVGALVSDPVVLLALTAAVIVGYAFMITTEIGQLRTETS